VPSRRRSRVQGRPALRRLPPDEAGILGPTGRRALRLRQLYAEAARLKEAGDWRGWVRAQERIAKLEGSLDAGDATTLPDGVGGRTVEELEHLVTASEADHRPSGRARGRPR
jgi:hypothetical protein